jgi:N-acetylglucosaminyl-diphospho-decaprenol L-rhamnosyltransferase
MESVCRTEAPPAAPPAAPEVSVCVVNWNCRDLLRACLESLRPDVQGVSLEVIVVDNGSTDGAADMVAAAFPGVTLLRNADNRGFARANNQAAAAARGDFLFFLNNDAELPPGALRRLLDFARARPEAGLVGPRLVGADGVFQVSFRRRPTLGALLHRTLAFRWTGLFKPAYRRYRGRDGDFETTRPVEVLMGAALLVRRRLFEAVGGWDESYVFGGEDIDLCARVGRRRSVVYHPAVTVLHHGRAGSRQHIGYVHAHTVAGITRFLRRNGASPLGVLLYKAAVTAELPLHWLGKAVQYLWRRLRGRREAAERSRVVLRALGHFLVRGLRDFWRA